jgi:hypothetical protein
MIIAIPTYMREAEQNAYKRLPEFLRKKTILFTHSGRAKLLRAENPTAEVYDMGKCDGIADVRQSVVDHCELMGHERIFMVDDQCYFNYRNEEGKLRPMDSDKRWQEMWDLVNSLLDYHPQVGISPRPGNNRVAEDYRVAMRAYSCYGLNIKIMREQELCFDGMWKEDKRIKLYEDFYFLLSMLAKGIPNAVIFKFAHYHTHGMKGGNSHYRNNDTQKLCIDFLAEKFPGSVKLVKKDTKTWGVDKDTEWRWDCTVSWKKTYEKGLENSLL